VLYLSLVPIFFHRATQKWLRNLVSRSETMDLGIPCNLITSLKYNSTTKVASLASLQGMKWAILRNDQQPQRWSPRSFGCKATLTQNPCSHPPKVRREPVKVSKDLEGVNDSWQFGMLHTSSRCLAHPCPCLANNNALWAQVRSCSLHNGQLEILHGPPSQVTL